MRAQTTAVLDAAIAAGVDWIDTARSYGDAEEFVGAWWRARAAAEPDFARPGPTISSKWGYRYVGAWDPDAPVHEVKDHSLQAFEEQWALTAATLPRVQLYQVHSLTVDSPLFDDTATLDALAALHDHGVAIGFSTSGPAQAAAIERAMAVRRNGAALFSAVQATWNLLEPSAAPMLQAASRRELTVIVKEALANGRLATTAPAPVIDLADRLGVGPDAVALAAARSQPWVDRVLLGPASPGQLADNLRADEIELTADDLESLTAIAEEPDAYWSRRSALPWR